MAGYEEIRRRDSAVDLAVQPAYEGGLKSGTFDTSAEMLLDEQKNKREFLMGVGKRSRTNRKFFSVNGSPIYGAAREQLRAGTIPLFEGAALNLENAALIGEKKFMKPPKAEGVGGMLALMPKGSSVGILLPLDRLRLQEDFVEGELTLNDRAGFRGQDIMFTGEKVEISREKVRFTGSKQIFGDPDSGVRVPLPDEMEIDENGFHPREIELALQMNFLPGETLAESVQETDETGAPAALAGTLVFPGGGIRRLNGKMPIRHYDQVQIFSSGEGLTALVQFGDTQVLIEDVTENQDGTFRGEEMTIPTKAANEILNIIRGMSVHIAGKKDMKESTVSIVLKGLTIGNEGITFESMRNSGLELEFDDMSIGLGNDIRLGTSGDLLGKEDEDDSYLDLLTTIYDEFFGSDEEDEDKKEDENNFKMSIPFMAVPIFPGVLSLEGEFSAKASVGYGLNAQLENIAGLIGKKDAGGFSVGLGAYIKGMAQAGVGVGLVAGPNFFLNLGAYLKALMRLGGNLEDGKLLNGNVKIDLEKGNRGMPHVKAAELNAEGGIALKAAIEGSVGVKVLGWEKELYTYTFGEWELGAIEAAIGANYERGGKWKASASANYRLLAGRISGMAMSKEALRKMVERKKVSQDIYDASKSSLENAKELLLMYSRKTQPVMIGTENGQSGFMDMNEAVKEVEFVFYNELMKQQDAIEFYRRGIEKLKNDGEYQKAGTTFKAGVEKHDARINQIQTDVAQVMSLNAQNASGSQVLEAYKLSTGGGKGFKKHLLKRAEKDAVTVERLTEYEQKRIEELSRSGNARIAAIREFAQNNGIGETDRTKGEILAKRYRELGGKMLRKAEFTPLSVLREWEENRQAQLLGGNKSYQKHKSRVEQLNSFLAQNPAGTDKINPAFYAYYVKELGAGGFNRSLAQFAGKQHIMQLEEQKRRANGGLSEKEQELAVFEQKRERKRQLEEKNARTEEEEKELAEINTGIAQQLVQLKNNKKSVYMTATRENFADALRAEKRAAVIKNKMREMKENNKTTGGDDLRSLYFSVRDNLTLEDCIEYETRMAAALTGIEKMQHEAKKRELEQAVAAAETMKGMERAKFIGQALEKYLFGIGGQGGEGRAMLGEILRRAEKEDFSVQKYFSQDAFKALDTDEIKALEESDLPLRDALGTFGGKKTNARKRKGTNRALLEKYMKSLGPREYTEEDLLRSYEYELGRAGRITRGSDRTVSEGTIYLRMKQMYGDDSISYADMLKTYEQFGRKDSYLSYLQEKAPEWVTPQMILDYEQGRMGVLSKKHDDRIKMLREGELLPPEEQREVAREYALASGLYEKEGSDASLALSPEDLILMETEKIGAKTAAHRERLEILGDASKTEEERVAAYNGSRFSVSKDAVVAQYMELMGTLTADPQAMADELTSYETERRTHYQELVEEWEKPVKECQEFVVNLVEQAQKCYEVVQGAEKAIQNPESIFGDSDSGVNQYIDQVLTPAQQDQDKVPEMLNSADQEQKKQEENIEKAEKLIQQMNKDKEE